MRQCYPARLLLPMLRKERVRRHHQEDYTKSAACDSTRNPASYVSRMAVRIPVEAVVSPACAMMADC